MNKNWKQVALLLLTFLLLLGLFPASAFAEEDVLFTLTEPRNMAITVAYETEPPVVSFIAPNGDVYDDAAIAEGKMEFYDSGSVLYFRIPGAAAGEWKIVYDKKSNPKIEVNYAPYAEAMCIDHFSYDQTDRENRLQVQFQVSHGQSTGSYHYVVWAVTLENNSIASKVSLREGTARLGEDYDTEVSLDHLNSYSDYKLMLEVYMESYGAEVFDTYISEKSFSYTNPNAPEAIADFKVEVGVTDQYIRLDWKEHKVSCETYIVVIRGEGVAEPLYAAEIDSDQTATEVLVELIHPSITCELAYKNRNGLVSHYASKTIDLSQKDLLTFVCDEVTSAVEGKVEYDFSAFSDSVRTILEVNGSTEEAVPSGKGSFSLKLQEYNNDIKITWFATDSISFAVTRQVYSDRKAPILKLYEMTGPVVTEESSFILTGSTDPGCTVTVGDASAQVDENGLFTIALALVDGVNEFTVTATSKTGNSTKQVITIEKPAVIAGLTDGKSAPLLSYLPGILSLIFGAILCIFAFANSKAYGKKLEKDGKFRAILALIRNISIFVAAIALLCSGYLMYQTIRSGQVLRSSEFVNEAYHSVAAAYALIAQHDTWQLWMIVSLIVLGVSLVIAVLCGIFGSEKHLEKAKLAKEEKQAKKAAAEKAAAEKAAAEKAAAEKAAAEKAAAERAAAEKAAAERAAAEKAAAEQAAAEKAAAEQAAAQENGQPDAQAQDLPKFCPMCGQEFDESTKFCGKCGHKLS